ncbi:DUF4886 domain-containing protein [uncultured Victivallis sp.]|uniref:DUF4886 domain-containing protein n=1 Tax=uncultured Victivallis sp. TaxID=354118 RepID=UPI0025FDFF80|nr:DUF4886 domain-containing protein [uncultured Victivallis sp.]
MNILTIGNSFTDSLELYFPAAVQSARCDLHFERANFGGCELARHWSYIEAEERDVRCRIYQGGRKLRSILELRAWDVVTIQQASHDSWRPETFQPWAGNIIAYVKKHAPQAEVVIQQTWAYRADHPQLLPGSEWGVSQDEMYERLTENYTKLARDYKLRIIPTGYAVQLTRRNSERKFVNYDPALIDTLAWPDLPSQAGDVVGQCSWRKNPDTGELYLNRDLIHLNPRGQYLQACVWFAMLYGKKVSEIRLVPAELANSDVKFLQETAQQAVDEFQQVNQG